MKIEERVVGGVTIIDLSGRMTRDEGHGLLKDKINSLVQQGRTSLLLNLARVPYMDSTCVGKIVGGFITVKNAGARLKLLSLTQRIEELLVIAKLTTVFEPFDSEKEALGSFPQ